MFDFIPSIHRKDPSLMSKLYDGPSDGEIVVLAQTSTGYSFITAMTRFCPSPGAITAEWCRSFASEASSLTNSEIARVEARIGNKLAVFWCAEDCLRIYEGSSDNYYCIYEHIGEMVCRDSVALMDSGCGNPYARPVVKSSKP